MLKKLIVPAVFAALFLLGFISRPTETVHAQAVLDRLNCIISSTATSSTTVTGCEAPSIAGRSIYLRSLQWYSSIISTTSNFMTIQDGTGGNCASAVTVRYNGFTSIAFGGDSVEFNEPVKIDANSEVCFLHAGAGTRFVNIQAYVGP